MNRRKFMLMATTAIVLTIPRVHAADLQAADRIWAADPS